MKKPTQEQIEKHRAEHKKHGCFACGEREAGRMAPSYEGNVNCESGSIASGGNRAHCTCDLCF